MASTGSRRRAGRWDHTRKKIPGSDEALIKQYWIRVLASTGSQRRARRWDHTRIRSPRIRRSVNQNLQKSTFLVKIAKISKDLEKLTKLVRETRLLYELLEREPSSRFTAHCHRRHRRNSRIQKKSEPGKSTFSVKIVEVSKDFKKLTNLMRETRLLYELLERGPSWRFAARCHRRHWRNSRIQRNPSLDKKIVIFVKIVDISKDLEKLTNLMKETRLLYELLEREPSWRFTARCHRRHRGN